MDFNTLISLETKQILSQKQVESLNILSMSLPDLHQFLQSEEIENPLLEYSMAENNTVLSPDNPKVWESERFHSGVKVSDNPTQDFYQVQDAEFSLEELVYHQLTTNRYTDDEKEILDMAINSLDDNGYLSLTAEEISESLEKPISAVEKCLKELKQLEPKGIFAHDLVECLELQIEGLDRENELREIVRYHLTDVAEGKISNISRTLKLPSVQVRKLIQIIRRLNPKPLNGYSTRQTEYIIPDIIFRYTDKQWFIELNDQWAGDVGINDFYVRMMESSEDLELKKYFENKLKRARFITKCVEQRRTTLTRIAQYILKKQDGYFLDTAALQPMTLEEIANAISLNKSTISRAIKEKYIASPRGCVPMKDLFTVGLSTSADNDEMVSRNVVKEYLKEIIDGEDQTRPYSDEKLSSLLLERGVEVSRRTVAKYRTELGIAGVFARKLSQEDLI